MAIPRFTPDGRYLGDGWEETKTPLEFAEENLRRLQERKKEMTASIDKEIKAAAAECARLRYGVT